MTIILDRFIFKYHCQPQAQRRHEEQIAIAKSHAARVTHKHRQARRTKAEAQRTLKDAAQSQGRPLLPKSSALLRQLDLKPAETESSPDVDGTRSSSSSDDKNNDSCPTASSGSTELGVVRRPDTSWQWTNGVRQDPFGYLSGIDDQDAACEIDFLITAAFPQMPPGGRPFTAYKIWDEWLLHYLVRPELRHVVVAMMMLARASFEPEVNPKAWLRIYRRRQMSISALRRAASCTDGRSSEDLLLPVLLLNFLDGILNETDGEAVHKKMILTLISQKANIDDLNVEQPIKNLLRLFMTMYGEADASTSSRCSYLQRPFDMKSHSLIRSLPEGFQSPTFAGEISTQTSRLIKNIQKTQVGDPTTGLMHTPPSLIIQEAHCLVNLAELCPALTLHSPSTSGAPLDKLICLALICFSANGHERCSEPKTCVYHRNLDQLMHELPTARPQPNNRDCLLWIWLVVLCSWSDGRNTTPEGLRILQHILSTFPEIHGWDLEAYKNFGSRFFWNGIASDRISAAVFGQPRGLARSTGGPCTKWSDLVGGSLSRQRESIRIEMVEPSKSSTDKTPYRFVIQSIGLEPKRI